jgi:PhzF family phenazine biosynthesis protein
MPDPNLFHVDVFATGPLTGNGLIVFLNAEGWSSSVMQRLTQEMRQFESIFLAEISPAGATARIFTVEEELPFAGHPALGAAAVLHRTQAAPSDVCHWRLKMSHGTVPIQTERRGDHYLCEMNQGKAMFGDSVDSVALKPIVSRLGLDETAVVRGMTAQVVSTGLPYLIVPVSAAALSEVAIHGSDLEALLGTFGAKFLFVLDIEGREIRTWDNLGRVEDVATGSAAGPAAAYLFRFGLADPGSPLELAQGRFAGRPSRITVVQDKDGDLLVSGEVWPVSHGVLEMNPGE